MFKFVYNSQHTRKWQMLTPNRVKLALLSLELYSAAVTVMNAVRIAELPLPGPAERHVRV